jgi:hypothetical protein
MEVNMLLPCLQPDGRDGSTQGTDSVLLAVYAPFGSDPSLSTYPDGSTTRLTQHPLLHNLLAATRQGVHVAALVDGVGPETCLVEIPARHPGRMQTTTCWKQDMASPYTLAGFLNRAHATHPTAAIVLVIEGQGLGFMPEIDQAAMRPRNLNRPLTREDLLVTCPWHPAGAWPMSTWGLGHALRVARGRGVPRLAVLHLNHSFSMSVEVMHTVAPHAEYATGYSGTTYFTAGGSYAWVFEHLARMGKATSAELANWLAGGSGPRPAAGPHTATGGAIQLDRMADIAHRIDNLSDALLATMRGSDATPRSQSINMVQRAVEAARRDAGLATSMGVIDLGALAGALKSAGTPSVSTTAAALESALRGRGRRQPPDGAWGPASAPRVLWDALASDLAMNIHFPDPFRRGAWDWRSAWYMDVSAARHSPTPHAVIDFLKETDWVDFIDDYHLSTPGPVVEDRITGHQVSDLPALPGAMVFELEVSVAAPSKGLDTHAVMDAAATLERMLQQQLAAPRAIELPAGTSSVAPGGERRGTRREVAARSVRPGSIVFSFEIFVAVVAGAYAVVGSYSKAKASWLELKPDLVGFLKDSRAAVGNLLGASAVSHVKVELRGSDELDRELQAFSQTTRTP